VAIHNPFTSKETCFAKELKIASKWTNMLNEKGDSNTEKDDDSIQTTRKLGRGRPKKVNIKILQRKNL